MDLAASRIRQAVKNKERVIIMAMLILMAFRRRFWPARL